jgi:septum formation protein
VAGEEDDFVLGDDVVLGADTVVAVEERIYGKPRDLEDARATLRALSGQAHTVIGGICLIDRERTRTAVVSTVVQFRDVDERWIDSYLKSGEWHDRAGGYAIQGRGAALVERIEGDYLNVVGLPVAALLALEPGLVG